MEIGRNQVDCFDDETSREDVEKGKESGRCCCEEDWEKKRPPFEWGLLV